MGRVLGEFAEEVGGWDRLACLFMEQTFALRKAFDLDHQKFDEVCRESEGRTLRRFALDDAQLAGAGKSPASLPPKE